MIFVTKMEIIPGKTDEAMSLVKEAKAPEEVSILHFFQMFGKPDFYLIFDAPNEDIAIDFVMYFTPALETSTSLGVSVDEI